jgi:hypothetical protein
MNIPPTTALPKGTYLVTDDLVTALNKIPGLLQIDPLNGDPAAPLTFPDQEADWVLLPNGTILTVEEDHAEERLTVRHAGAGAHKEGGSAFAADQALLDRYLD